MSVVDSGYGSLDMLKVAADASTSMGHSQQPATYQRSASSRTPYYSPIQSRRSSSAIRKPTTLPTTTLVPSMKDTAYDRVVFNTKNK